jgi:hypothetical protein
MPPSAAQERISSLFVNSVTLPLVARRVVERHEPLHSSEPRERSRLPRRQMAPRLGERRVGFEECRFDKEDVSIFCDPNDLLWLPETNARFLPGLVSRGTRARWSLQSQPKARRGPPCPEEDGFQYGFETLIMLKKTWRTIHPQERLDLR